VKIMTLRVNGIISPASGAGHTPLLKPHRVGHSRDAAMAPAQCPGAKGRRLLPAEDQDWHDGLILVLLPACGQTLPGLPSLVVDGES
jgi:hypothetical protein